MPLHPTWADLALRLALTFVAGALLGRTVDTHGDRTTGTVLGAAGGALVGHALDSKTHCR